MADDEDGSEEAVRVFVRIRPLNKRELAENQTIGWNFNETSLLEDTTNGQRVYAFDKCYGPEENNTAVYERVGKPVVLKAMEGYNGTVFTYGQTGSGKTYTMRGCDEDPGMMILCIRDIFDYIENHPKTKFNLKVAYLEVYNEEINDLLGDGPSSKNLRIVSEDAVRGAVIGGLTEEPVSNGTELLEVLRRGEHNRSYGSTTMNAESSRSHTIYRLSIESEDIDDEEEESKGNKGGGFNTPGSVGGVSRMSFMNLVDLAGSERQKSTNATGKTLKEGANINKSLLALGAVINKLGEASKKVKGSKPVFLPYRDSKLTRILKQSLGGNTLTSILCTVTPAPMHREETVSTLKFGQLCKTIKNNVKSNEVVDERTLIKQYRSIIHDLRLQLAEYESGKDSNDALQRAQKEKVELEQKVKELELLLLHGGGKSESSNGDTASADAAADLAKTNAALLEALNGSKRTIKQLSTEVYNLESNLSSLQAEVDEIHNLEDLKSAFEDYQNEIQSQIEEERNKMDREKEMLQAERTKTMAEKTHLDEKEGRLGLLLAALDERESKLRQHLNTLKEQQAHWNQSISDLTRREELVEEWQTNHRAREKKLKDWSDQLDKKFNELSQREANLAEMEHNFKVQQRGFSEREQRLQVALSRVANSEQTLSALEEKLTSQESYLKVREGEADVKERELATRRRELEQWDSLLREKDRKVVVEQRQLEEREEAVRALEGKVRARELDCEKKSLDLRQKDAEATILVEKYTSLRQDLEQRERHCAEQTSKFNSIASAQSAKESALASKEIQLKELEVRFMDTKVREAELEKRVAEHEKAVDTFYKVEVAQITARHAREMAELEELVEQQLVVVSNFQSELEKVRGALDAACKDKDDLKAVVESKNRLIEKLQDDLNHLEEEKETLKEEVAEEAKSATADDKGLSRQRSEDEEDNDMDFFERESSKGRVPRSQRSLLSQLAETQAMLRAVLEAHDVEVNRPDKGSVSSGYTRRPVSKPGSPEGSVGTNSGAGEAKSLPSPTGSESGAKTRIPLLGASPPATPSGPTNSNNGGTKTPGTSRKVSLDPSAIKSTERTSAAAIESRQPSSSSTPTTRPSPSTRGYTVTSHSSTPPAGRPGTVPVASVSLGLAKSYKTPPSQSVRKK